jgi:RimJ/RimL family protein N-acetyltransferase
MIESVSGERLQSLLPLFDFDFPNRTTLLSYLEGRSPGVALVDHLDEPTACIVSANLYNFTFIGGTPDAEWLAEAINHLRRERYLLIVRAPWLPNASAALPQADRTLQRYEFLHPQPERQVPPVPLPSGYSFRPLDAELLKRCAWYEEMVVGYGSDEAFLANALGFCLMHGDEICCETYALFPAEGHYEIGAVTHKEYQGKGFAYATCLHLAKACASRGFETSWSCDQDNPASIATARKLGYATQREYQFVYYARQE